jgi:Alcohol dehydrogenase GroES-like domain
MRAMSATGFTGYGDLKLVDLPKPEIADGKVLVRVTAAGVTPLDHTILSGQYPKAKAPLVLGNEGSGDRRRRRWNGVPGRFAGDVHRSVRGGGKRHLR